MTAAPDPLQLSETQAGSYRRDGFLALDCLTDIVEIESMRAQYDDLFRRASGFADGDRIDLIADGTRTLLPQIVNPERYAPALVQGLAYRNAQAIARRLLGANCIPMGNHAVLKPAEVGASTPWHQDEAYWDPRKEHCALSVWMPLQPANHDNGCMQFIKSSHHGPVLPHELIAPDSHGLRIQSGDSLGEVAVCEIPAGGATVHDGRTVHCAGPNRTREPRRALIFGFCRAPVILTTPHQYPWQRPEWFGPNL